MQRVLLTGLLSGGRPRAVFPAFDTIRQEGFEKGEDSTDD